ncbi:MAG TPA: hypothetical protein RMF84_07995, partial [Polyangiaceae bacterium LLY-WYZ-14_1]|nr:hypothetical protein [Polyangiaceae bacterium LLY-WYZ-14_1]
MAVRIVLWQRGVASEAGGGAAAWTRRSLANHAEAWGGVLAGGLGASAAAIFPGERLDSAIEAGLLQLDEAEAAGHRIALGLALGEVDDQAGVPEGAGLDRAAALAGRARSGELLVDAGVLRIAEGRWLFRRRRRADGVWGAAVDRR